MTFSQTWKDDLRSRSDALQKDLDTIGGSDTFAANFAKIHRFGSNHFRRWQELDHLRSLHNSDSTSNEAPFRLDTFRIERCKQALFIGDSHAEFGCRLPVGEPPGSDYSTCNYWLGPVTMMGVLTNRSLFEEIARAISMSDDLHSSALKRSVIFSFGEIDIRHVVYRLILMQKFKSCEQYLAFLQPLLEAFFGKLTALFPGHAFFMLQPVPTSKVKPYSSPTDEQTMAAYYEQYGEHPSLGSPEMRRGFWNMFDEMTAKICELKSVHYMRLPSFCFDNGYLNSNHTADNTHISSLSALKEQELRHEQLLFAI